MKLELKWLCWAIIVLFCTVAFGGDSAKSDGAKGNDLFARISQAYLDGNWDELEKVLGDSSKELDGLSAAQQADEFAAVAGGGICGKTGRHVYTEWDPIFAHKGGHVPAMNPYEFPQNKKCRMKYTKDILLLTPCNDTFNAPSFSSAFVGIFVMA